MIDRGADDAIRAWLSSGPDTASAALVERTLGPIPHMHQRRGWRSRLPRLNGVQRGLGVMVATAAALVILIALPSLVRLGGPGIPSATPSPSPGGPTFELHLDGTSGSATHGSDASAPTNLCTHARDGSWRWIYGGGAPYIMIDMLVGPSAGQPGSETQIAVEIEVDAGYYVRFDPSVMRGGDAPGRSTASVQIRQVGGATQFTVSATTPDRTTGEDGPAVDVELTVTCPG
jgi:hypothetical protein